MKNHWIGLSLCLMIALTACAGIKNDLAEQTYTATDNIMDQADHISQTTPVLVGTLTDVDALEISSTFGRMVAEQISTRLTQTGYDVTELKMRTSLNIKDGRGSVAESGEYMLSRDVNAIKSEQQAAIVVTGTYAVASQNILVNLKLLDVATGKILGATDYTIRKDANVSRLFSGKTNAGSLDGESFYGSSMAF